METACGDTMALMKSFLAGALIALFFLPAMTMAEGGVTGGFPSGSIWLSKTTLTDGDSVQIFAAVYDAGTAKINGDTVFLVDGTAIGSVHFELNAGEAKIASLSWNAKQGTHKIEAQIQNAADTDAKSALSLSKDKTESITITVAMPPPQPAVVKILSAASTAVTSAVGAALPAVTAAAGAVFSQTENLRTKAQTALENSLGQTPSAGTNSSGGQVLGAQIENNPALAAASVSGFSPFRMFKQFLLFIVSYTWLFYPVLLLILLASFYILGKALSRRKPSNA